MEVLRGVVAFFSLSLSPLGAGADLHVENVV